MTAALADTHALLWWLSDDPRLLASARGLIATGDVPVHFSAARVWEAEIKQHRDPTTASPCSGDLAAPSSQRWAHEAPAQRLQVRGREARVAQEALDIEAGERLDDERRARRAAFRQEGLEQRTLVDSPSAA